MDYLEISEKVESVMLASKAPTICTDVTDDDLRGDDTGNTIIAMVGEPSVMFAVNMPEPLKSMSSYIAKGPVAAVDHIALVKGSTGAVVYYYDIFGGTGLYDLSKLSCKVDDLLANIKQYCDTWNNPDFLNASPVSVQ